MHIASATNIGFGVKGGTKKMYRIYIPNGGFVCKGSYIFQGHKYKVLGDFENAKTYKKKESAHKDREKMMDRFANIDHYAQIVFKEE